MHSVFSKKVLCEEKVRKRGESKLDLREQEKSSYNWAFYCSVCVYVCICVSGYIYVCPHVSPEPGA